MRESAKQILVVARFFRIVATRAAGQAASASRFESIAKFAAGARWNCPALLRRSFVKIPNHRERLRTHATTATARTRVGRNCARTHAREWVENCERLRTHAGTEWIKDRSDCARRQRLRRRVREWVDNRERLRRYARSGSRVANDCARTRLLRPHAREWAEHCERSASVRSASDVNCVSLAE